MKTPHFLALLKYPGHDMPLFLIPVLSFVCALEFVGACHFSLGFNAFGFLMLLMFPLPLISIGHIFRRGTEDDKSFETLEFFFSKAIDRTTLYYVKASLYLVVNSLPFITVLAYSFTKAGQAIFPVLPFAWAVTAILAFQVSIFAFPRVPRWILLSPIAIFALLGGELFVITLINNSTYEKGTAWAAQHAFMIFLGLGLLTAFAQIFCCRRFANREIIS